MDFPFDALPGAPFIRTMSPDIVTPAIREYQRMMNVPCLDPLGCRFLALCTAMSRPKTIIDIGCGLGASTISMYFGAPNAHIDALDANLDRYNACKSLLKDMPTIKVHHSLAISFLKKTEIKYDFAFVDTIKKDYMNVWCNLKDKLNPNAVVVFDDVMLHGYTSEEEATVPLRYRDGRNELRQFIFEISNDPSTQTQIIPLGGGMLLTRLK